jgi:hypothetical protein
MKKQTAVEWLESKIIQMVNHGSDFGEDFPALAVHLNKAKEMEKEQIGRAYQEGLLDGLNHTPKDYYNETFNTNDK